MGNGYAIHGTNQPQTVGRAVSHGCVRLRNEDIAKLYAMVPVGTPVYIYRAEGGGTPASAGRLAQDDSLAEPTRLPPDPTAPRCGALRAGPGRGCRVVELEASHRLGLYKIAVEVDEAH